MSKLLLFLIRIYWWTLSPVIGSVCRFQPSCSRYTAVCIDRFGAVKGSWLGFVRICKCQPFHPGGYDPPPPRPGEAALVLPGLGLDTVPTGTASGAAAGTGSGATGEKRAADVHPA